MKQIILVFIVGFSSMFSSCSIGLVAVHQEPPFICFKKQCRELARNERKNGAHVVNSGKRSAKLNSSRKKHKRSKSKSAGRTKKSTKTARFN